MLREQREAAVFAGGLDVRLIDKIIAEELCSMRIRAVWLAADTDAMLEPLREAASLLAPLGREKLRCYVLLGFRDDTPDRAERRLRSAWEAGCIPFAQLYQPGGTRVRYNAEWRKLAWIWSRPAAMRATMKENKGES